MNQRTRELWLIPVVVSLATGLVLLVMSVFVNAWLTGVALRTPRTLGWVKSILQYPIPVWTVLLICMPVILAALYLNHRASSRSTRVGMSPKISPSTVRDTQDSPLERDKNKQEKDHPPLPSLNIGLPDSLVCESADQYLVKISTFSNPNTRGVQLRIENYRLTAIHQVQIIVNGMSTFDSRHDAYRESLIPSQTFNRPNAIAASCSGVWIPLIWKDQLSQGLVIGEGNFRRPLIWPENDSASIEVWRVPIKVLVFDQKTNENGAFIPLRGITIALVLKWNRKLNSFELAQNS